MDEPTVTASFMNVFTRITKSLGSWLVESNGLTVHLAVTDSSPVRNSCRQVEVYQSLPAELWLGSYEHREDGG